VQLVDGRDLGAWLVRLGETLTSGVFNATGPAETLTMERFLDTCRAVARSDARFTWVDEAFLVEQKVGPYSELPLWVPEDMQAFETVNVARAVAAGLTFRPLDDTVRDTLAWVLGLPPEPRTYSAFGITIPPALTREREAALLAAWRERTGASGEAQPATTGASA
jgi:2'-hydroxyisoflavone reductase